MECPFCGSNGPWKTAIQPINLEEEEVYGRDENRYSICDCGGHFQNPTPTDASIVEHYQGVYRTIHPDVKFGHPRAKRVFQHLPPKAGDMLDVGCARGHLMALAKEARWQVWGVEPDENTAREARKVGPIYDNLAEVDRAFDLVASVHVLEHMSDPLAFLRQKAELIKPGGEMLIVFPYYNYRTPHLLAMGGDQVRALLNKIGISEVEIEMYDPAGKHSRPDDGPIVRPVIRAKTYMDVIVKASVPCEKHSSS